MIEEDTGGPSVKNERERETAVMPLGPSGAAEELE